MMSIAISQQDAEDAGFGDGSEQEDELTLELVDLLRDVKAKDPALLRTYVHLVERVVFPFAKDLWGVRITLLNGCRLGCKEMSATTDYTMPAHDRKLSLLVSILTRLADLEVYRTAQNEHEEKMRKGVH